MEILRDFPELERGFAGIAPAKPTIMIAMTPRTGSTQLCAALEAAGFKGRVTEYFNPRGVVAEEKARLGVERFADYFRAIQASEAREFIFKTCWRDFKPFAPFCRVLFPDLRVIYLDRADWAGQVASHFRAEISGFWHQGQGQEKPAAGALRGKFDAKRVAEMMREHEAEKRDWERFFAGEGLAPLRFDYAEIAGDVNGVLRRVAAGMGVALRDDLPADFGFQKIGDGLSEEWRVEVLKLGLGLT